MDDDEIEAIAAQELDKLKKSGRKPHKSGGAVGSPPVSKTQKIVNFLGGKDAVA